MGLASWLTVPHTHTRSTSVVVVVVNPWYTYEGVYSSALPITVLCVCAWGDGQTRPCVRAAAPRWRQATRVIYLWRKRLVSVTAVSWHGYCVRAPGQEAASRVCPRRPACCSRHEVYLETADIWPPVRVRDQNGWTFLRNWPKKQMRHAFYSCLLIAPMLLFLQECN